MGAPTTTIPSREQAAASILINNIHNKIANKMANISANNIRNKIDNNITNISPNNINSEIASNIVKDIISGIVNHIDNILADSGQYN